MKIKVMMVGPSSLGGISGLIRTLLPVLEQKVILSHLTTVQHRPPTEAGKISLGNVGLGISQYARFVQRIIRFRPTIIHLHTSQGIGWLKDSFFILGGKFLRRRVVLHIHASDFDKFYASTPQWMQAYTRWVIQFADAVLSVSAQWQDVIARIVPKERVYKFINCIDIKSFQPHYNVSVEQKISALFLGAVGERKGVPELLEAMSLVASRGVPLYLWIAGPEEKSGDLCLMRTRLIELHLEDVCELTGDVREERKTTLMQESNLFVLPSHHEGLPIALIEAMAAGLAVVSTTVGGIPEIIQDGHNGFLISPGDVDALADRLTLLANDPRLCETMGRRNRRIAEQALNVDAYVTRLVDLYESII